MELNKNLYQIMYSSCPHIIKHFVSMKFSQTAANYQSQNIVFSAPKVKNKQSPLKNMKLKSLQTQQKNITLIFKNKSFKQFEPIKKIQYHSLKKQLNLIGKSKYQAIQNCQCQKQSFPWNQNGLCQKQIQEDSGNYLGSVFQNCRNHKNTQFTRAQTSDHRRRNISMSHMNSNNFHKFRPSSALKYHEIGKCTSKQNNKVKNKKQKMIKVLSKLELNLNSNEPKLKIRGVKAPKEQVLDYFKITKTQLIKFLK